MDCDILNAMTVQITLGVKKEESDLVNTDEDSQTWDRLAAEIAEFKASGEPGFVEVPFDSSKPVDYLGNLYSDGFDAKIADKLKGK